MLRGFFGRQGVSVIQARCASQGKKKKVVSLRKPKKVKKVEPEPVWEEQKPVVEADPLAGYYQEAYEEKERKRREMYVKLREDAMRKQEEAAVEEVPAAVEEKESTEKEGVEEEPVVEWTRRGAPPDEQIKEEYFAMLKEAGVTAPKMHKVKTAKKKKKKSPAPMAAAVEHGEWLSDEAAKAVDETPDVDAPIMKVVAKKRRRSGVVGRTSEMPQLSLKTKELEVNTAAETPYESFVEDVSDDREEVPYYEQAPDQGHAVDTALDLIEAQTDAELRSKGVAAPERAEIPEASYATISDEPPEETTTHHSATHTDWKYVSSYRFKGGHRKGLVGHKYRDGKDEVRIAGEAFNKDAFTRCDTWESVYATIPPSSRGDPLVGVTNMVEKEAFADLTTVQKYAIPLMTEGHNLLCQAPTGTGKTLCYLLPALQHIAIASTTSSSYLQSRVFSPRVLVLCGARAAAIQTTKVFKSYTETIRCSTLLLTGTDEGSMHALPERGCDVIVGTLDVMYGALKGSRSFSLKELRYVVIDDPSHHYARILKIMNIIKNEKEPTDPQCQVSVWSATVSQHAAITARQVVACLAPNSPITHLKIGHVLNRDISHKLMACSSYEKIPTLKRMLENKEIGMQSQKCIVFCTTPEEAFSVKLEIERRFVKEGDRTKNEVLLITSGMHRGNVANAIKTFQKSGNILVATGIASMGYDVPEVDTVVCLGIPHTEEEWVHAVGRCARGGKQGRAITLITPLCAPKLLPVLRYLRRSHFDDPVWKAPQKVLTSGEGYVERKATEGGVAVEGIVAKKLDISPQVLELADRMGYALHKLGGVGNRRHQLAHDGVTFDGGVDKYDLSGAWKPSANPEVLAKRQTLLDKKATKNLLRGAHKVAAHKLIRQRRQGIGQEGASSLATVQKAMQAREERQSERVDALENLRQRHIKDYRASQVAMWRQRTGLRDNTPDKVYTPNTLAASPPTPGGEMTTQVHKMRVRRKMGQHGRMTVQRLTDIPV